MQDDIHRGQEDSNSPSNDQHWARVDGDLRQFATLGHFAQSFLTFYMSICIALHAT